MRSQRTLLVLVLSGAAAFTLACGSNTPTTPTTTTTSPVTDTWTGLLGPNGNVTRSFITSAAGTVTVTLTASDVPVGIGIGVPRSNNSGCRLTVSQTGVAAGVALTTTADTGTYCVQLFDVGNVVKQAAFSVQIVYP